MPEQSAREVLAALGQPERLPDDGPDLPEGFAGFQGQLDYRNGLELTVERGKVSRISLVKPGVFTPATAETLPPTRD